MSEQWDARLRERFGLSGFRPWQREAIAELLEGSGHVLAIAPTGGGKSLCYQFPATELSGTTIVVSPLISLMEDQVRALTERGIAATYLASNLDTDERRDRARGLREGRYRLVYVAPERLAHDSTVAELRALAPPLVAIDEAHCISQWGHDFRPDYLRLGRVLRAIAPPRILACTATATPLVRAEILERLGLGETTKQVLRGFARPNLHLSCEEIEGTKGRFKVALRTIKDALGSPSSPQGGAIVYAGTRKQAESLGEVVAQSGWKAAAYHAGLEPEERARVSRAFADRSLSVVVATNAFGMGIDRPDVRTVIHVQAPGSIEAYYQEVGRAGRDGQPAFGLLLTGASDVALRRRLIEHGGREGPTGEALMQRQWKLFLDLMRYMDAGSCRHDFILRYFGDEGELLGGCGHCDVCAELERTGAEARTVSDEDAIVVRKALSGVARVRRGAGLGAIAKMLHGDTGERVQRLGLERHTTHGILSGHGEKWILSLLRRLITAGLVDITPSEYPVAFLTATGVQAMKGDAPIRVLPPPPEGKRAKPRVESAPAREPPKNMDHSLFDRLKAERLRIAREMGVPAYVICHDRTLMEMAADRPRDKHELAGIPGMGPQRINAYGAQLLAVINA